jgi:hypothetical protein
MAQQHKLQSGGAVCINLGALRISAALVEDHRLVNVDIEGVDPDHLPFEARPNEAIVTQSAPAFTVRVRPPTGLSSFAGHSTLIMHMSVLGADSATVMTESIHVAGLGSSSIVRVTRQDDGQTIKALWVDEQKVDGSLTLGSDLTQRARATAVASLSQRPFSDGAAVKEATVVVGVDGSASMRLATDRGDLAAVLDVIDGIQQAVLPNHAQPAVAILRDHPTWIRTGYEANGTMIPEEILDSLDAGPYFVGAHLAEGQLAQFSGPRPTIAYVVTNGIPGDFRQMTELEASFDLLIHLVVIGNVPDEPSGHLTVERTMPGVPLRTALTQDTQRLAHLVDSLLAGLKAVERRHQEGGS